MHRIIRTKAYEAKHGPHFDEEHARKAVSKMENEDGSREANIGLQKKLLLLQINTEFALIASSISMIGMLH